MNSAIYKGTIHHRRLEPSPHEFSYRMFMLYLDLDELDEVTEGSRLFSSKGKAIAEFRRSDHLGDPDIPLDTAVRNLAEEQTGQRPSGPIRLLTHLRYFGYVFNPVSFYYCFERDGETLEAIVAEVNNTPWGERHCYVLPASANEANSPQRENGIMKYTPGKEMHVSPFMPMDIDYDWRFRKPGEKLGVHMTNFRHDKKIFDATLRLERGPLTGPALARSLAAFPLITLKVIFAIHWQALRLWIKKVPFHPHPSLSEEPVTALDSGLESQAELQEDSRR